MDKESLIKALKGGSRTQVDPNIGQVQLNPTLGRYGNYNVVTEPTSKNSSATQLARALMAAPQVVGQFKNIQEAAGILEANELTTEELETRFNKGDVEADGILSQLFKDQAFQQQVYTRKFDSEVTPGIRKAKAAIKNRNVEELAGMSDEGYAASVQQELASAIDPEFLATVENSPHMARIHNRAMERVIPHTVEELVAWKNKEVKEYTKVMGMSTAADAAGLGFPHAAVPVVDSNIAKAATKMRATAFGDVDIDPTTAAEVKSGRMAEVNGDPLIGSSGMEYRGLEDSVPTVAVNPKSGFVAGDMIHVVSDLFPDGKVFEVAGTGPASGRLDFFATNKDDYNKLAKQKLKTVTKLDPESIKYEAKAIPVASKLAHLSQEITGSITRQVERLAGLDGTNPVERRNAIADNLVNAFVFKYDQDGDLETPSAWLQLAEDGKELFIDGKPYAATEQGRSVVRRLNAFVEKEEAANERGVDTIGKKASESAAQDLIYRAKKAKADAAAAVRNGEDPTEYIDIFNDVYAEATDAENKVLYSRDRVKVLDVLSLSREQADRYLTDISIDDEQDYQAVAAKNNWTAILSAGSKADSNYANLPRLLKGINYNIGDYKSTDPRGGMDITNPKIFPLADMASSKARKDVLDELGLLPKEELATALEQKPVEDRYKEAFEKYMEPLMLNEFGDPAAPPAGLTPEQWSAGKATKLEAEQGDNDLVDGSGKLQRFDRTPDGLKRALRTFGDEATFNIVQDTNSPAETRRLAMHVSSYLFGQKDSQQKIGEALDAGSASRVATHVKLFGDVKKIGIPMRIHRNGGLFEFSSEYIGDFVPPAVITGSPYGTPAPPIVKKTRDHSIDFNAPTKQFPNGRFNDIRTSKESIYNMEAIRWYVKNSGDDSKLRELAELYDLDPDKFITNQLQFAEDITVIDPQPKPE